MQKRNFTPEQLEKVKYCYFKIPRLMPAFPTEAPYYFTTVTVAYLGNKFGIAIQSLRDEFNKAIGRDVSCGRLSLEKTCREFPFKPEEVSKKKIGEYLFGVFKENPELLPFYFDVDGEDETLFSEETYIKELKIAFIDFPVKPIKKK